MTASLIEFLLSLKRNKKKLQKLIHIKKLFLKKLHGPFLLMGFNCLKNTEPLRGSSLLFTTKFPEIPGTYWIDLGRMKD